jgi:hypothetical protein
MLGEGGSLGIKQERDPRHSRSHLFEYFQPFAGKRILIAGEASGIAARMRKTPNDAASHRIGKIGEHDRYCAGFAQESLNRGRVAGKHHVGFQIDEFLCDCSHTIKVTRRPAIVGAKVTSLHPAQFLKGLPKGRKPSATFRVSVGIASTHDGGNPPHAVTLLRAPRAATLPHRRAA